MRPLVKDSPPIISIPMLHFYLYDVRENKEMRMSHVNYYNSSSPNSLSLKGEAVNLECSYIVSAWAEGSDSEGQDQVAISEHYLLSLAISALYPNLAFPDPQIIDGISVSISPSRSFTIQKGYMQNMSEFWDALGNNPRPLFNYQATASLVLTSDREVMPLSGEVIVNSESSETL